MPSRIPRFAWQGESAPLTQQGWTGALRYSGRVNQSAESLDTPSVDGAVERPTIALTMLDDGIEPPAYALPGDAGADLRTTEDVVLEPGARALVPTGVALALPVGFVGLVHPRSGLAVRQGLSLVNAPGTIDAGYRGEIKVPLLNTDRTEAIRLRRGDRIAQLVIQRVAQAQFVLVDELPPSDRGAAGFGSTGGFGAEAPVHGA